MKSVLPAESVANRRSSRGRKFCAAAALISVACIGLSPIPVTSRASAAFPGRNGPIAFEVERCPCVLPSRFTFLGTPYDYDIFAMSSDGSAVRQVTQGIDFDVLPAWSPDGRNLTFTRAYGRLGEADVYVTDFEGTKLTNLTPNTPTSFDWGSAWSPDGRRIAFISDRTNPSPYWMLLRQAPEGDLYVMDADGSSVRQLTSGPGAQIHLSWSPDGRWIAFVSHYLFPNQGPERIGLIRPDGSDLHFITPEGFSGCCQYPRWSPDGKRIVFSTDSDIWVIDPDGSISSLRNLTADREDSRNINPAWSPDGRWIAFLSTRAGDYKIFKMRTNGSDVVQLTDINLSSPFAAIDWGPRP